MVVSRVTILVISLLAAVLSLGAAPTVSAAPATATYTFAFQDADVSEVAQEVLGQAIGVTYTLDPSVTAKLTFRIDQRLTKEQLLKAFEAVLSTEDIVLVRQGDSLLITTRAKARGAAGIETSPEAVHHAGFQTVAVPLNYATASEVAKALQSISPNNNIVVYVDDKAGLLILGGTGDELEAAIQMVHVFDHSGIEGAKIRWFELSQASAETVAGDLDKILQAAGAGNVTIIPLKRLNGLFVFARSSDALDQVSNWVAKLDTPSKDTGASLWVYHPRNLSADSLADTLNSVLSGQTTLGQSSTSANQRGASSTAATPPPAAPAVVSQSVVSTSTDEDPVRVGVDKESNTLLISASLARWLQIQKILDQIDQTPGQVLIEASILEVTLTNDDRFGVDWSVLGNDGRLGVSSLPDGSTAAQNPGFSVTFLSHGISASINALGSRTALEVLSQPKIVALDNRTAKLQVGDQVPEVNQTSQNTTAPGSPIINSVNYQNTGVIMSVTPRITGDDRVFLDIDQEVSSVVPTTTSGIDSPTIQQRELQSSLILADGGTVALGGLISNERNKTDSGLPWVKDVPVIGNLFKTQDKTINRTELIVLLTATIIKDQPGANKTMARLLADMREIEARGVANQ